MDIFLHLIWTMTHLVMSRLLEDIIGEELTAINWTKTFIQVEKMVTKLLIMTVTEYSVLTEEEKHMKNYFVLSLRDSELQ
jgi:uncharacterized protein YacL (UPF0231 family)